MVLIVALFAMGEVLYVAAHQVSSHFELLRLEKGAKWLTRGDWARSWKPWLILVAFQQHGIQPGPQLLDTQSALVWGLIASLLIADVILLALNLPLVGLWVKILEIPKPYLFAGIMTFALLGTYAVNGSTFDVVVLLVLGTIGYLMRRFGFPITPMIVRAILGPLAEVQLRRALDIAGGDVLTSSAPRSLSWCT